MDISTRTFPSPSAQASASVLPPCEAARHVSKRTAYYNIDSCPYPVYAVDPVQRNRLVPEAFKAELLKYPEPWTVYQYKLHDRSVTPQAVAASMKTAIKLPAPSTLPSQTPSKTPRLSFPEPEDRTDTQKPASCWAYNWQSGSGSGNSCRLPLTENLPETGLLAIYNNDTTATLQVQTGTTIIAVPPQQGAIFKAQEGGCWNKAAEYVSEEVQSFYTNPLMHDHGPMLDTDSKVAPHSGEYYLLPHMVQDLAAHHSPTHSRPQLCKSEAEVREVISTLPRGTPVTLLLQHDNSPHIAAVLLLKTDDDHLLAYVHKTLEPGNPVELDMLHMVCDAMISAEGFDSSFLLTPEYKLQKDFSSCSTYALEALIAFASAPELFSHWLEEEVLRGRNTFLVAQNYADQYTRTGKASPLTEQELERYRQEMLAKVQADPDFDFDDPDAMMTLYSQIIADRPMTKNMKACDLNYSQEIQETRETQKHQLNIFYTQACHTPTALLRLMQANTHELDSRLDDVIDDNGTTLRQYRQHHTHEVPNLIDPENGATRKVFLGALCERYARINEWAALKGEGKVFPPFLRDPGCQGVSEQSSIHFPFRVRHAASLDVATQWFDSHGLTGKPSQSDYDYACDFEEFITSQPCFNPASAAKLKNWIDRLVRPKTHHTPREQLLREWLKISMHASPYRRKKITSVQKHLKRLHRRSTKQGQGSSEPALSRTCLSRVPANAAPLIPAVGKFTLKTVTPSEKDHPVYTLIPRLEPMRPNPT